MILFCIMTVSALWRMIGLYYRGTLAYNRPRGMSTQLVRIFGAESLLFCLERIATWPLAEALMFQSHLFGDL